MMKQTQPTVRFFSLRTLRGLLAGIAIALIFIIFFKQPGLFTPIISIMLASWVAKIAIPKHLAVLGALIAIPAGLVGGLQFALQMPGVGLAHWIAVFLWTSIIFGMYLLWYPFLGFVLGQIIRLYRRGALF